MYSYKLNYACNCAYWFDTSDQEANHHRAKRSVVPEESVSNYINATGVPDQYKIINQISAGWESWIYW